MDNLRNFLEAHRDEMDVESPSSEVWQRLNKPAKKAPVVSMKKILHAAAAACVLVVAGWLFITQGKKEALSGEMAVASAVNIQLSEGLTGAQPVPDNTTNASLTGTTIQQSLKKVKPTKANTAPIVENEIQMVVKNIDENFNKILNAQLKNISQTPIYGEAKEMFDGFKNQYRKLEIEEKQLKTDITNFGMQEQLLQQLIFINQQKLDVLKSLQVEINKVNNNIPSQQKNKQQYFKM